MFRVETKAKISENSGPFLASDGELVLEEKHFRYNSLIVPYKKLESVQLTKIRGLLGSSYRLTFENSDRCFLFTPRKLPVEKIEIPLPVKKQVKTTAGYYIRLTLVLTLIADLVFLAGKFV